VAFVNRGEKTTYVVLAAPRGGRWTVKALDGDQIAEVKAAGMRAPVRAKASVKGKTLRYSIPRVKGQTVTFEERGAGVAHVLGTVKGGAGKLRFTPADGKGGTRKIVALVEQDGLPRKSLTVAQYKAPPRAKPGLPGGLNLKVPGTFRKAQASSAKRELTVTWGAAKGAARYGVRVVLPDGRKLFFLRTADDRSVRIANVPAEGRAIVRVVGLRKDNTTGPAATANTSLSSGRNR
jgi:hypothetical protein